MVTSKTLLNRTKKQTQKFEPKTPIASEMFLPNQSGDHSAGTVRTTPTADTDIANKKYVDDNAGGNVNADANLTDETIVQGDGGAKKIKTSTATVAQIASNVTHTAGDGSDHADVATNTAASHAQSHTVASHSDTTGTGAELDTLTDNSIANTLHRHSELVASDGSPDPAVSVNTIGGVTFVDNIYQADVPFLVKKSTKSVGIGTTTPTDKLNIVGDSTDQAGFLLEHEDATSKVRVKHYAEGLAYFSVNAVRLVTEDWDNDLGTHHGWGISVFNDEISPAVNEGIAFWRLAAGGSAIVQFMKLTESGGVGIGSGYTNTNLSDGVLVVENKVGIGVLDPHSKLEVAGAISSATATLTDNSDNYDVSGINVLFVNITANKILGGLSGGVDGQVLHVVYKGNYTATLTVEDTEGVGTQDIYTHTRLDETIDGGGYTLVCDGSDWYDTSHARHV